MNIGFLKRNADYFYFAFRVIIGLLFMTHGLAKLGALGKPAAEGFMLFIGIAETLGGLAIALGFLTQLAAIGTAIIMIGAYVTVHAPKSLNPVANGGELALVYLAAFLVIMSHGARRWGIDNALFKEKTSKK